ncbi:MAG: DUF2934 domain-containing protein [Methylobacteriaceae bacterium]|nr:DUF2934 domain-containing protein [Methylobacteriaceae bacterium]
MDGNLEQQVRQRAYELWLVDGKAEGRDLDYWYAAEDEIMRGREPATAPAAKKARPARKARSAKKRK